MGLEAEPAPGGEAGPGGHRLAEWGSLGRHNEGEATLLLCLRQLGSCHPLAVGVARAAGFT